MIPSDICIDACVFVAALDPREPHFEDSINLIRVVRNRGIALYEPAVVLFEVVSALHRKVVCGELLPKRLDPLIDLFFQLPLLLEWRVGLMKKGSQLAGKFSLKRIYDCCYLSVAIAREIPFITLDSEFSKKAAGIYRHIYTAESFLKEL